MKAQTAFEYMIIVMIILGFLAPIWYYMFQVKGSTSDTFILTYAKSAASEIAENADLVYSQRYDAQVVVDVYLPPGIQNTSISGNEIRMTVYTTQGIQEVFEETSAQLQGTIPATEGRHRVLIRANGNYVEISQLE